MGLQRVRHNWATELNQQSKFKSLIYHLLALGPETSYFSVTLCLIESNNIKLIRPQQDFLHFLNRTNSWVSISTRYVPWFIKTSSEIWTVSIKCFLQYFIFCWGLHILTSCIWLFKVKLCALSCPTLCDPMDSSPPGSSVHGISQARIPEWVAISFSGIFLT